MIAKSRNITNQDTRVTNQEAGQQSISDIQNVNQASDTENENQQSENKRIKEKKSNKGRTNKPEEEAES